jgi:diguanylate cyclase (GGDEF)-like protein
VIVLVAVMVFCCMVANIVLSLITMHKMSMRHTEDFMEELSDNVYGSIRGELTRTIDVAETVAHDSLLIHLLESEGIAEQEEINRQMSEYTTGLSDIFSYLWVSIVSDETGAYYLNDGLYRYIDPESNPGDAWYTEIRNMEEDYCVSLGVDNDETDKWTLFVDTKIANTDGKFLGICGIAMQVEDLQDFLSEYESEYGIEILFVDENGDIQLKSGDFSEDSDTTVDLSAVGENDTVTVDRNGIRRDYTITKYMEELQWYMIISNVNPYNYSLDYLIIGGNIVAYIVILGIAALCMHYMVRREGNLYNYSYHDSMTGLYNRRAYDEEINRFREEGISEEISIAAFDVNGLKQVNDLLGHSFGDRLIVAGAHAIYRVFQDYGKIYRTGGDEFVAIIDKPVDSIDQLGEALHDATENWNGEADGALNIAFGFVTAKEHPGISIDQLTFLADEEMYRKKTEFYRNRQEQQ